MSCLGCQQEPLGLLVHGCLAPSVIQAGLWAWKGKNFFLGDKTLAEGQVLRSEGKWLRGKLGVA